MAVLKPALTQVVRKIRRAVLRDEPGYYDMFENRGERYFARLYLHQIEKVIRSEGLSAPLRILDAGCQAGRLAIPLAKGGHRVTGVDSSGVGLRRAARHAKEEGAPLTLIRAELSRWLSAQPEGSFDAVICSEVLYLRENFRTLLGHLIHLLRSRGLCFISHRPPGYYLAEAFQRQDRQAVELLRTAREGKLWGSYYNWQTREDLDRLYRELQVEPIAITPIGFFSWLAVNPEELDPAGQDLLFQADLAAAQGCPGSGRYLLLSGRKR